MTTQEILQGVHNWTLQKVVYDISAAHLDGQGNPTPYVDLAAALGTNGGNIPQELRKGGISVKFIQGNVQSSDNKYVQYRLMSDTFNTIPANWQGVDDEPIIGSKNLITSNGVAEQVSHLESNLNNHPYIADSSNDSNLDVADENGYVLAKFKNGHIETKNFNSLDVTEKLDTIENGAEVNNINSELDSTSASLDISDENGYVILRLENGHIKTKNFDSERIVNNLKDVVWSHFGDSISTNGAYVELGEHFYDIISERNNMTFNPNVNVIASSGWSLCHVPQEYDEGYGVIVDNLSRCVAGSTLITIFAGVNDYKRCVPLGEIEFSENTIVIPSQSSECNTITKGLCYMYNYLQYNFPQAKIAYMLPTLSSRADCGISHVTTAGYSFQDLWNKIIEISKYFSVEVIKLGPEVGMNPYNRQHRGAYYISGDNLHLSANGQLRVANYIEPKLRDIMYS